MSRPTPEGVIGERTVRRLGLGTMSLTGHGTWGDPPDPAAARELLDDDASPAVIVLSDSGYIVQVRVAGAALVLAALFDGDESVGQALASARETALELSPITSREVR